MNPDIAEFIREQDNKRASRPIHDYLEKDMEVTLIETPKTALATSPTPADLLRIAVESGADLDRLERLMALQERWEASEAKKAYDQAFSAFKAEAVRIVKNRDVTAGPLAGKKYAELFAVVNAITPALSKHGLSSAWKITRDEKDWIEVTCTLRHVGGHSESVSMGGPPDAGGAKNPIQARASTVSYLERYTLKAITGLSEQDDDTDGTADGDLQAMLNAIQQAKDAEELKAVFERCFKATKGAPGAQKAIVTAKDARKKELA